jgi:hypothetical protein
MAQSHVTPEMIDYAKALRLALAPFREVNSTMPIQFLDTFLMVIEGEGRGVREYANDAGVSMTVMTRHLLDIGERDRHGGEGYKLIYQQRDREDLRVNRTYVSPKGAAVLNKSRKSMELLSRLLTRNK